VKLAINNTFTLHYITKKIVIYPYPLTVMLVQRAQTDKHCVLCNVLSAKQMSENK